MGSTRLATFRYTLPAPRDPPAAVSARTRAPAAPCAVLAPSRSASRRDTPPGLTSSPSGPTPHAPVACARCGSAHAWAAPAGRRYKSAQARAAALVADAASGATAAYYLLLPY